MSADLAAVCAELRRLMGENYVAGPYCERDLHGILRYGEKHDLGDCSCDRGVECDGSPWSSDAPLIVAALDALPTLLEAAERLGRVRCAIEAFGCGCDPEVGHVCEVCSTLGAIGEPCHHERALAEYKAAVEPILCDAAESADPAGLLRAADMVPAQAIRDLLEVGICCAGTTCYADENLRALLPEERTP